MGLNLVLTNTSDKKFLHCEESLEKMSKANLGRTKTREHKEKISKVHKGKVNSIETKNKISKSKLGKTLTKEHRDNISKSQLGVKKVGRKVINTETKEIFDSIKLAADSIEMKYDTLVDKLRGVLKNNTNLKYL